LTPIQHALWLGCPDKQLLSGIGDCPDWAIDELWMGGRGKARGYRGSPNPSVDCLVEHDGRAWHRTCLAAAPRR
jgi:hypothetical protein